MDGSEQSSAVGKPGTRSQEPPEPGISTSRACAFHLREMGDAVVSTFLYRVSWRVFDHWAPENRIDFMGLQILFGHIWYPLEGSYPNCGPQLRDLPEFVECSSVDSTRSEELPRFPHAGLCSQSQRLELGLLHCDSCHPKAQGPETGPLIGMNTPLTHRRHWGCQQVALLREGPGPAGGLRLACGTQRAWVWSRCRLGASDGGPGLPNVWDRWMALSSVRMQHETRETDESGRSLLTWTCSNVCCGHGQAAASWLGVGTRMKFTSRRPLPESCRVASRSSAPPPSS